MGEHIDWALLRPKMAAGMGKLSEAVYGNSQLSVREREAARWTIALDQRLRGLPRHPRPRRRDGRSRRALLRRGDRLAHAPRG